MCGIAGILRATGRPEPGAAEILPALAAMARRGPDGQGVAACGPAVLGHRRLAIVDPAGGAQPISTPDGALVLVANGEIHDWLEHRARLAAAGARFATRSDTEVLLNLLAREGVPGLAQVTGMFAFALWEPGEGRLTLGRDPFGVKPLLYAEGPEAGEVRFASEMGALLALGHRPRLDLEALAERLAFQFPLGDRTLVAGVRAVPPGTALVFGTDGTRETHRYHEVCYAEEPGRSEKEWVEELRAEVVRGVRLALRADATVGLTLSGGLDSGLVAGIAGREAGARPAFTGFFDEGPEFDERIHARLAAAEAGLELVEVPVSARDFTARIRDLAVALEGPIAGPGSLPQLVTLAHAAERVKVVLTGQGADETFGGYARQRLALLEAEGRLDLARLPPDLEGYRPLARHFLAAGRGEPFARRYGRLCYRGEGVEPLLGEALRVAWRGYDAGAAFESAFRSEDGDPFHRMASFERRTLLPALLHVEDRVSMRASVESRVPLLTPAIVALSARMPSRIAFTADEGKRVLRLAARGLAPRSCVTRRDKMGFPVPLDRWARGPLRDELIARLDGGPLVGAGILAADAPRRLVEGGDGHGRWLWFFVLLSEWMEATGIRP